MEGLTAVSAAGPAATGWPGGARAAVSLTYDDSLVSHLTFAAPAVTARGWKANFFVTLENMEDRIPDWQAVAALGHEIGNHTVHHLCGLPTTRPDAYFRHEVLAAQARFDQIFGPQPKLFAYPCGVTDLGPGTPNEQLRRYRELLQAAGFMGARTSDGEPMSPHYARTHRFALNCSAPTYEVDSPAEALKYLDSARANGRWAILTFHGLAPHKDESGGTSNPVHEAILDHIARGPFWCAPIGQVLNHLDGQHPTAA